MKEYDLFVDYYEEIVRPEPNQLEEEFEFLQEVINEFKPNTKSILECACGTWLIMDKFIKSEYQIDGLDLSEKMLDKAKNLIPEEKLFHEDMTKFNLWKKYDMVLCNYNSICHILKFEDWVNFFKCAKAHLNEGGVLLFDINTLFEFNCLAEDYTLTRDMWDDTLCLDVKKTDEHFYWDIKMFVRAEDGRYDLVRERVSENTFEIADVKKALNKEWFFIEWLIDYHKVEVTPDSERIYFVASKK